jgi:hypothetical protein
METININGENYVKESDVEANMGLSVQDTDHVIIIAERGWIFVGHQTKDSNATKEVVLLNASVVRKWDNGLGIGALAFKDHKKDYTLDHVGQAIIPYAAVIASIAITEW